MPLLTGGAGSLALASASVGFADWSSKVTNGYHPGTAMTTSHPIDPCAVTRKGECKRERGRM